MIRRALVGRLSWLLAATLWVSAANAEPVRFETSDGFVLHADWHAGSDRAAPVAILLHMYHSNRRAFAPLVPKLREAGIAVLAVDQRTHGESTRRGGETVRVEQISRQRFADVVRAGPEDVAAARRFLGERGFAADRLALVGASYGCTVSLLASRDAKGISALVLLSPGTAYFGVEVLDAAKAFPGPLLAVAAEDDPSAVRSARALVEAHAGEDHLEVYASGGHGTRLFGPHPEVMERIVEFLRKSLAAP